MTVTSSRTPRAVRLAHTFWSWRRPTTLGGATTPDPKALGTRHCRHAARNAPDGARRGRRAATSSPSPCLALGCRTLGWKVEPGGSWPVDDRFAAPSRFSVTQWVAAAYRTSDLADRGSRITEKPMNRWKKLLLVSALLIVPGTALGAVALGFCPCASGACPLARSR